MNNSTDRFLDNKIAEETPDFFGDCFGGSGNNPVRSS